MELRTFGEFLLKEFHIDIKPDWDYLMLKYRTTKKGSKHYGMPYLNFKVAEKFEIDPDFLLMKTRLLKVVYPRRVAMYLMRLCGHSCVAIGKYYHMDHSSVTASTQQIEELAKGDKQLKEKMNDLEIELL
jgi:chromosomal replication initiation ATPase DnaA